MRRTILRLSSIAILMAGSDLCAQYAPVAPVAPSPSSWGGSTGGYARGGYNVNTGYTAIGGSQNGVPVYAQSASIAPTYPSPSSWGGSTGSSNRGGYNSTTGYAIGGGSQNGIPSPSGGRPAALMDSSMIPAGVITPTNMAPTGNPVGATGYERPIGSVGSPTMGSSLMGGAPMGGPVSPIQQTNGVSPIPATGVAQPGTTWVESSEASSKYQLIK